MNFPFFSKPEDKPINEVGCAHCNNVGLEPNVPLQEAKECPVCNGSPFGVQGEEPVATLPEEIEEEVAEVDEEGKE